MAVLEHLEPGRVFHFFEQMSAIPRGSGNTKAVSDWLAEFARKRGLRYQQDALNNIIIFKDASAGYEGAEPVILQGHMDMVCEKAPDCGKDMTREGLDLAIDGDFVYAKGTTLGGDDGIAVAYALAGPVGVNGIWAAIPIGWFLADAVGYGYYFLRRRALLPGVRDV